MAIDLKALFAASKIPVAAGPPDEDAPSVVGQYGARVGQGIGRTLGGQAGSELGGNIGESLGAGLGTLGTALGSGLYYAGTTLNKPSRAAWGTASGLTGGEWGGGPLNLIPFSDTLGLTDPEQGIEAADFAEHIGVLPKNRPGMDWLDPVRIGANIVGDPVSYATGLGTLRAVSPAGQALQRAGALDDLTRASGMGSREFLSRNTLGDVLPTMTPAQVSSLDMATATPSPRTFTPNHFGSDEALAQVRLDPKKVDPFWQQTAGDAFYLPPGGGANVRPESMDYWRQALKAGDDIESPFLDLESSTLFRDGRHRFAALRELDEPFMATVPAGQAGEFVKRFGTLGDEMLSQPLGGQLGTGPIFGAPTRTFGTPQIGRAIDKSFNKIRLSPVGREAARLFNPEVRGGVTEAEQRFGESTYRGRDVMERQTKQTILKMADDLYRENPQFLSEDGFRTLRSALEQLDPDDVPFQLDQVTGDVHGFLGKLHQSLNDYYDIGQLGDPYTKFVPRGKHGPLFDEHDISRKGYLTDIPGTPDQSPTVLLQDFFKDPELHQWIDSGMSDAKLASHMRAKYGDPFDPASPAFMADVRREVLTEQMAEWDMTRADRQFRKKHLSLLNRAQGDIDAVSLHPRFDEIVDEYRYFANRPDATEDDVLNVLRGAAPKPTLQSIEPLAARRAEELRASYDPAAQPGVIPNTYTPRNRHGNPLLDPETGEPAVRDRFIKLARVMKRLTPEQRAVGLFRANPLDDIYRYGMWAGRKLVIGKGTIETLSHPSFWRDAVATPGTPQAYTLGKMLRDKGDPKGSMGLNPHKIAKAVLEAQGKTATTREIKALLRTPIKRSAAEQFIRMSRFGSDEKELKPIMQAVHWFHNLWKGSQTNPWPAFHVRNYTSGQIHNVLVGTIRPRRVLAENQNMYAMITGGVVKDAHTIPAVRQMLADRGLPATEQTGTDMLREIFAVHGVWDPGTSTGWGTDIVRSSTNVDALDPLDKLESALPGGRAGTRPLFAPGKVAPFKEIGSRYIGRPTPSAPDVTLNPLKAHMRGGASGAEQSTFGPFAGGELAGATFEALNRGAPMLDMLRRGIDSAEAAKRVREAQVDYSRRAFTDTEAKIKEWVPFYSFQRAMAEHVAKELLNRPGGPLAQVIKETARVQDADTQGEAAIPIGESPDGGQRHLTGLGLMHESPLGMIGTRGGNLSFRETGSQLLSAASPLIKGPLEAVTGQSFFMRGPLGGRELTSMDPAIGGTIENIRSLATGRERKYPAQPFLGSRVLEQIASNSPLSRALTTARTITDARKWSPLGIPIAAQLGTGLRVQDTSPMQQLRSLENEISATIRDEGGLAFRVTRFSRKDIEEAEKSNPERAARMRELNLALEKVRKARAELQKAEKQTPNP